jgi:hypothetical protein
MRRRVQHAVRTLGDKGQRRQRRETTIEGRTIVGVRQAMIEKENERHEAGSRIPSFNENGRVMGEPPSPRRKEGAWPRWRGRAQDRTESVRMSATLTLQHQQHRLHISLAVLESLPNQWRCSSQRFVLGQGVPLLCPCQWSHCPG